MSTPCGPEACRRSARRRRGRLPPARAAWPLSEPARLRRRSGTPCPPRRQGAAAASRCCSSTPLRDRVGRTNSSTPGTQAPVCHFANPRPQGSSSRLRPTSRRKRHASSSSLPPANQSLTNLRCDGAECDGAMVGDGGPMVRVPRWTAPRTLALDLTLSDWTVAPSHWIVAPLHWTVEPSAPRSFAPLVLYGIVVRV